MVAEKINQTIVQLLGVGHIATYFISAIIINTLILYFLSIKFKFKSNYTYALKIAVISSTISFLTEYSVPIAMVWWILPVYYLIDVVLIKYFYSQNWKKSFMVGLIWWVFGSIVFGFVLNVILSLF